MKTLIVYGTKYGFTQKLAERLAGQITGNVKIAHVKKARHIDVYNFDRVVIGTPIYMGNVHRDVRQYCDRFKEQLLQSRYWFFVVGLGGPVESMKNFDGSMDPELIEQAIDTVYFGGAYVLEKMNILERTLMKKLSQGQTFYEGINEEAVEALIALMNGESE